MTATALEITEAATSIGAQLDASLARPPKGRPALVINFNLAVLPSWGKRFFMPVFSPLWRRYRGASLLSAGARAVPGYGRPIAALVFLHEMLSPKPFVQFTITITAGTAAPTAASGSPAPAGMAFFRFIRRRCRQKTQPS